jgi:hypothetical protein
MTLGVFFGYGGDSDGARMYLRHTIRKKNGKVHPYWCLARSGRVGRRVIQQTVAHFGEIDEHGRVEARALAHRLIGAPDGRGPISTDSHEAEGTCTLRFTRPNRTRLVQSQNQSEKIDQFSMSRPGRLMSGWVITRNPCVSCGAGWPNKMPMGTGSFRR